MKRREVLRSMALAPLAGKLPLAWPASDPVEAVALYREAMEKLPPPSPADDELLNNVANAPLGRAAADLVERAAPSLTLLARGASAPSCAWGETWVGDGFDHVTDWIMKARRLGRLASLRARIAFEGGRPDTGIDDAINALRLGRHLDQAAVMIAQLIGVATEHATIEAIAASLPRLDRQSLQGLDSRFLTLPAIPDIPATVRAERAFFLGYYVPHNPDELDTAKVKTWTAWYDRLIVACMTPPPSARSGPRGRPTRRRSSSSNRSILTGGHGSTPT